MNLNHGTLSGYLTTHDDFALLTHFLSCLPPHSLTLLPKDDNLDFQFSGAPNDNFRKNICSEDDLRSRIFGTFVVKFLACLPLLGFSDI